MCVHQCTLLRIEGVLHKLIFTYTHTHAHTHTHFRGVHTTLIWPQCSRLMFRNVSNYDVTADCLPKNRLNYCCSLLRVFFFFCFACSPPIPATCDHVFCRGVCAAVQSSRPSSAPFTERGGLVGNRGASPKTYLKLHLVQFFPPMPCVVLGLRFQEHRHHRGLIKIVVLFCVIFDPAAAAPSELTRVCVQ